MLEKVGRSIVVHMPGCSEIKDPLNRFQEENPGRDPTDGWWFCESCTTDRVDITALLVEHNRHWVTISEDPLHIVDALYRRKEGARHLPRLSLELLDQAARVDDRGGVQSRTDLTAMPDWVWTVWVILGAIGILIVIVAALGLCGGVRDRLHAAGQLRPYR